MASNKHSSPAPAASPVLIRIVAVVVLFLSITASGLQVMAALNSMDHPDAANPVAVPALFVPSIMTLVVGIALSTMLEGIARLLGVRPTETVDQSVTTSKMIAAITTLQNALPATIADAVQQGLPAPLPAEPAAVVSLTAGPEVQARLDRMVQLLEEMKELSMLDDSQRQNRRKGIAMRRKASRLQEVATLLGQRNWVQADALLHLLESLHPGDAEVLALRTQLDDARILNQANDWNAVSRRVMDLLALSQYQQAIESVKLHLEQYPASQEAQQLVIRIRDEERSNNQSTSNRLYEQIKSAVENRQWRTALDGIQIFLARYPDHTRAEKIRRQIRVIQKNAEIEERHEQEERLKQLINQNQFHEAADLSEDLLNRFPNSPQSAYLADLVPKLRERSSAVADVASVSMGD